jgi:ABC-type Zn uptake system ZnuABC Zn-binding protein ZnuA
VAIGGDKVKVTSIARGTEDPHFVDARPSFVRTLNQADMLIESGTKVITYHKSFDYLLERFGLVLDGTIEPRPGIEPSPTHINALLPRAKADGVKLVIIEP